MQIRPNGLQSAGFGRSALPETVRFPKNLPGFVVPVTVEGGELVCHTVSIDIRRGCSVGTAEMPNLFTFELPIALIAQPNHSMIWLRPPMALLKIVTLAHKQIHLAILVNICGN